MLIKSAKTILAAPLSLILHDKDIKTAGREGEANLDDKPHKI
ncbi:MAG: hypothetical protein ACFC1C_04280 [Candidatus Malihini olakiniferum]